MNEKPFRIDFDSIRIKIQLEFNFFSEYIQFNINKLSERDDELEEMKAREISEEPNLKQIISDVYETEKLIMPSYFYHSSIVGLYSFFEDKFMEICNLIVSETGLAFKASESSDRNVIKRLRTLLAKLTSLDFNKLDKYWLLITEIQKIRNYIVHDNATLYKKPEEGVQHLLEKYSVIKEEHNNLRFYIISAELTKLFQETIRNFFLEIIEQLSSLKFYKFRKAEADFKFPDIPF